MNKKKLNDKIKRDRKLRNEAYASDDAKEIRRFAFILIGLIVIILIVYGVTAFFKKDNSIGDKTVTAGSINYDVVTVGTMLNKKDSEYYVLLYDDENNNASYYNTLSSMYSNKEKAKKVYHCNLGNALNSKYYVGKNGTSNPKATSVNDFQFGEVTLLKINNGKVTKYLETVDTIKTELGL